MSTQGVLIGISGASGSGKTLVARTLYDSLGSEKVVIIQEDAYYKDLAELSLEERTKINFDHPDAFDHSLLIQQVNELINGRSIEHPVYDFTKHTRKPEFRTVGPHSIVILEGILILAIPELRDLMDIKIFVDTPADICFIRRLERDIRDRERTVESVIQQYQKTVRPTFMQFIEPFKRYADIIIPHGGKNIIAIDIIQAKIENLLQNQR
ncbi:MAG: uridine kinase [Calditrichia bacterium]|nr:uridine kinase [Calditrichia bacterium]